MAMSVTDAVLQLLCDELGCGGFRVLSKRTFSAGPSISQELGGVTPAVGSVFNVG